MGTFELVTGDVTVWAKNYTGPKFHGMLSDFPYDLGFMSEDWDRNAQFNKWGAALLPLLHCGAVGLAFGGTRTWHRLASGLEDAGFEIWDMILWLYASGFPKGQDLQRLTRSPEWAGYKTTALKPAWEPILCLKSPLESTYAKAASKHGTGGLNVEACRIGTAADMNPKDFDDTRRKSPKFSGVLNHGDEGQYRTKTGEVPNGRYPANLIIEDEEIVGEKLSRFFYCAKAANGERNMGLPTEISNDHPTVKPVKLTTYLAKLLLPPPIVGQRRILVPFSGSGSEVIGCLLAGWDEVVGIELDGKHNDTAKYRCDSAVQGHYNGFVDSSAEK